MNGDLDAAADRLDELAAAATPGPWHTYPISGNYYGSVIAVDCHRECVETTHLTPGFNSHPHDGYGGCLIGESIMSGDRPYIAAMHPAVGALLADLLRAVRAEDPAAVGRHARAIAAVLPPPPANGPTP